VLAADLVGEVEGARCSCRRWLALLHGLGHLRGVLAQGRSGARGAWHPIRVTVWAGGDCTGKGCRAARAQPGLNSWVVSEPPGVLPGGCRLVF
jgi:hypothetical protein